MFDSPIVLGNRAVQSGQLELALKHYRAALRRYPHMAWVMRQNIERTLSASVGPQGGSAPAVKI